MTWSTLPVYSDGNALTAAEATAIKDNINETAPAKATTQGYWFIAGSSANTINQRAILTHEILTQQTTTNTSYVNLATVGPTVTLTTGTKVIVAISCQFFNSSTGTCWSSYAVSGATTTASNDQHAISCEGGVANQGFKLGATFIESVTGGSNTLTQQYRVSSSTGNYDDRHMVAMGL